MGKSSYNVKLANPLFVEWLQEMVDESTAYGNRASGRPNNMLFTYRRALANLKKYPLPLRSGLDAVKVSGIGTMMAKRLEDKLQCYLQEKNTTVDDLITANGFNPESIRNIMESTISANATDNKPSATTTTRKKAMHKKNTTVTTTTTPQVNHVTNRLLNDCASFSSQNNYSVINYTTETQNLFISSSRFSPSFITNQKSIIKTTKTNSSALMTTQQGRQFSSDIPTKTAAKKPKLYIPRYRSGSYAILVGMYLNRKLGYLTKQQIINLAQTHCDVSMDIPDLSRNGASGHTGWSGIKTLLEKDLVFKSGNPARYCLCDEGMELAKKLIVTTGQLNENINEEDIMAVPSFDLDVDLIAHTRSFNNNENISTHSLSGMSQSLLPSTNQTSHLSLSGLKSICTDYLSSSTTLGQLNSLNNLVSFEGSESPDIIYLSKHNSESTFKYNAAVLLTDRNCLLFKVKYKTQKASKLFLEKIVKVERQEGPFSIVWVDDKDLPESYDTLLEFFSSSTAIISSQSDYRNRISDPNPFNKQKKSSLSKLPSETLIFSSQPSNYKEQKENSANGSQTAINKQSISSQPTSMSSAKQEMHESLELSRLPNPIAYSPGSYRITVVLDNREVRTQQDRSFFQSALMNMGIRVTTRSLSVGDAIWVASPFIKEDTKTDLQSTVVADCGDDIILGYVMERKTLDDLVASIQDGRWREQKFRLQECAADHVIYLIEKNSMLKAQQFGMDAIMTSLVNTQLEYGFFVKETAHCQETVEYIATMTRYLESRFQNKTIHVIPSSILSRQNFSFIKEQYLKTFHHEDFHITFSAYQELSTKSKSLTARDLAAKILMCIRGVSAEKASHIIKHYPTIRSLKNAYIQCSAPKEGQMLLKTLGGFGRKSVQNALSIKIYSLFCSEKYEDSATIDHNHINVS